MRGQVLDDQARAFGELRDLRRDRVGRDRVGDGVVVDRAQALAGEDRVPVGRAEQVTRVVQDGAGAPERLDPRDEAVGRDWSRTAAQNGVSAAASA